MKTVKAWAVKNNDRILLDDFSRSPRYSESRAKELSKRFNDEYKAVQVEIRELPDD